MDHPVGRRAADALRPHGHRQRGVDLVQLVRRSGRQVRPVRDDPQPLGPRHHRPRPALALLVEVRQVRIDAGEPQPIAGWGRGFSAVKHADQAKNRQQTRQERPQKHLDGLPVGFAETGCLFGSYHPVSFLRLGTWLRKAGAASPSASSCRAGSSPQTRPPRPGLEPSRVHFVQSPRSAAWDLRCALPCPFRKAAGRPASSLHRPGLSGFAFG